MKKIIIFSLIIANYIITGCEWYKNKTNERPNIIIILADDLGYSDLGCFESKHVKTPVLDNLARNGIRLTNFYAGSAVCSPSRVTLLTGKNHNRVGVYSWIPPDSPMHLPLEEPTIPNILKQSGYQTAHFGKWHLSTWEMSSPDEKMPNINPSIDEYGFDYYYGCDNNALLSHKDPYNFLLNGNPLGRQNGYSCQLLADQAISWLKKYKSDEPFYMQLWFNEPHEKVAAPEKYKKRHLANGISEHLADYYGSIENMDEAIGRVLETIKNLDISKQTLILFTSDNGSKFPGSNGFLKGRKGQVWEGGIRVPAILYWEDYITPNYNEDTPCGVVDFFSTICDITNNKNKKFHGEDGESFYPLIKNKSFVRKKPIYTFYFSDKKASLRDNDWSLIGHLNKEKPTGNKFDKKHLKFIQEAKLVKFELYNLKDDPGQTHDVSSKYPSKVARMEQKMEELFYETIAEGVDWYEK
jgi:arylsulfatase A